MVGMVTEIHKWPLTCYELDILATNLTFPLYGMHLVMTRNLIKKTHSRSKTKYQKATCMAMTPKHRESDDFLSLFHDFPLKTLQII